MGRWFTQSDGVTKRDPIIKGDNKTFTPIIIDNARQNSSHDQMYQISTSDVRNSDFRNNILLMRYQMSSP